MLHKQKNELRKTLLSFMIFGLFTLALKFIDVKSIGPEGSKVGFADLNQKVFEILGRNETWYFLTDLLGVVALLVALVYGVGGLLQLIRRRSLWQVDAEILAMGIIYLVTIFCYLLFEDLIINYRPILIDGLLEASYPSSHTMLLLTILLTSICQLKRTSLQPTLKKILIVCFIFISGLTVVGRLLSGVHWLTDIIGGILLSVALVYFYCWLVKIFHRWQQAK
ncbi:phosphatase PAP2 family protein [Enterococcus sp. LJL120]